MIDIEEKVYDIIVDKLAVPRESLKMDSDLAKDLGADSLDMVELIMEFERVFKIAISDDEVEKTRTIGQIIKCIEDHTEDEGDNDMNDENGCGNCEGGCPGCNHVE